MDEDQSQDTSIQNEDQEWDAAVDEYSEDAGVEPEDKKEEDTSEDKKEDDDASDDGDADDDKKADENAEDVKDTKDDEGTPDDDTKDDQKQEESTQLTDAQRAAIEQRSVERESKEFHQAIKEDIREELFSDVQTELRDAEGDPIKTIEDVQKLINPATQEAFTEEEAAVWLLQAQQDLNTRLQETEKGIEMIAETNLALKDEADIIRERYGELFKAMPDVQKQVWSEFEKTLIKDPKTGIVLRAPVSLESFYSTALAGYTKLADMMEEQAKAKQVEQPPEETKQEEKVVKKKAHTDREDIYSGGKSDTLSAEDKEWAAAAKEVFN